MWIVMPCHVWGIIVAGLSPLNYVVCLFWSFCLFPIQSTDQPSYLIIFFVLLLLMNLTGATPDIATDGLAVNLLKSDQQHWGNTFQVIGSRHRLYCRWWSGTLGAGLATLAGNISCVGGTGFPEHITCFILSGTASFKAKR